MIQLADMIMIAFGLSMDAACVAISDGISMKHARFRYALLIGLFFGFFQALMPLIGYFAGSLFSGILSRYSVFLVSGIFLFLGGKMIVDALSFSQTETVVLIPNLYLLFTQAIATSIDALIVGIGFSVTSTNIYLNIAIIGTVAFFCSSFAFLLGKQIGKLFHQKAPIIGGILLLLIGVKSLLEQCF